MSSSSRTSARSPAPRACCTCSSPSRISSRHALEATRLAAETIRNEYYYDESAGIRVCIQKAISTANKRLAHQADRLGLKSTDGNGPIGIGLAVVRGNEMYVGHGRAGRGVPDPAGPAVDPARTRTGSAACRRATSSRTSGAARSRSATRSCWSPRTSSRSSARTSSRTPCSRSTRSRRWSTSTTGSSPTAAPAATARSRSRRPRSPPRPRPVAGPGQAAGAARGRPGPLADPARRQRPGRRGWPSAPPPGARKVAAGGAIGPRRPAGPGPDAPARSPRTGGSRRSRSRRETQRRAALAAARPGRGRRRPRPRGVRLRRDGKQAAISSVNAGQQALDKARDEPRQGQGPRDRPRRGRPGQAKTLLTEAYQQLDAPSRPNVSAAVVDPLRAQVVAGLDALYGVVPVASTTLFTFKPAAGAAPIDLGGPGPGPGRRARTCSTARPRPSTGSTSRTRRRRSSSAPAQKAGGTTVATPQVPRGGRPGPADPRRQERPVALAAVQRRRARAR